jgi:hypothetical protein
MNEQTAEWQAPPPPESIEQGERAQMSEVGTLAGIFFEPGRVFEDLRRKPRFILASLLIAAFVTAYGIALAQKVGDTGMRSFIEAELNKNPQMDKMPADQRKGMVDIQMGVMSVVRYAMPIFMLIIIAIGGLLYWLAAKAFGGQGGFLHNLSVWVYSAVPPTVVTYLGSFLVMVLKPADEINLATSQRGLLHANPTLLVDGQSMPVLATLIGTLDIFFIWGWILAAIGLRITNRLSSGSAWAIVIIFAIIGTAFRVISAVFSGNPA